MSFIHMDKSVLAAMEADDQDQPIVILNMYRFRDVAESGAGVDGLTGREAFDRFREKYAEVGGDYGGKPMWSGSANYSVVGEEWDLVVMVRYPTRGNAVKMLKDPRYEDVLKLRAAAISDGRIIEMTELMHPTD